MKIVELPVKYIGPFLGKNLVNGSVNYLCKSFNFPWQFRKKVKPSDAWKKWYEPLLHLLSDVWFLHEGIEPGHCEIYRFARRTKCATYHVHINPLVAYHFETISILQHRQLLASGSLHMFDVLLLLLVKSSPQYQASLIGHINHGKTIKVRPTFFVCNVALSDRP